MTRVLAKEIRKCKKCPISQTCRSPVPGIGDNEAKIIVLGQNPGVDEDAANEPFVGRSGKLLDKMLKDAGLNRSSVYITNLVKCWTPGNRPPEQDEIDNCKMFLWKEILLIQPRVIVSLGMLPTRTLMRKKTIRMGDVIGKPHQLEFCPGIHLIPNWHPSFILRNGLKNVQESVDIFKIAKDFS